MRMTLRNWSGWTALLLVGALCAAPATVHAEAEDDASRSAARTVGTAGVEAFQKGDYVTASEKLERAYHVLRVPSIGLWSARALAKTGKLVAASERYREATQLEVSEGNTAIQKQAQADAATELDALTVRIPGIVIQLAGSGAAGAVVTVDGSPVSAALLGERRPVDPGTHTLQAKQGERQVSAEVTVAEGETKPVSLTIDAPAPSAPTLSESPTAASEPAHGLGGQRIGGLVVGGVGIIGVAVGSVFGLKSKSDHDQADSHCTGGCDGRGVSLGSDAISAGNVSTVAFLVGAAGLVGGAALWLTAKHDGSSAQVGFGPGAVLMRGTW